PGTWGAMHGTWSPAPERRRGRAGAGRAATFRRVGPAVAPLAIGDGEPVWIDRRAAQQETDRRQRHVIGRVLVEPEFIRIDVGGAHRLTPSGAGLQEMRGARRQAEPAMHRLFPA